MLAVISVFMFSCTETTEDIGLPAMPQPVVVSAYIFPGIQSINVYVHNAHSLSTSVVAEEMMPVVNAMVNISNSHVGSVSLAYSAGSESYKVSSARLPIVAGQIYALSIQIPGRPLIEASVKVPFPHEDFGIELTNSQIDAYSRTYYLKAYINDTQGQQNSYQLFGTANLGESCNTEQGTVNKQINAKIFDFSPLLSDENRDGQTIHQSGYLSMRDKRYPHFCTYTPLNIHLKLIHFEYFTYQYLIALQDFDNAQGNPFAEHVIVPSNMTNAVGIFGAYAAHEKTISWDELEK